MEVELIKWERVRIRKVYGRWVPMCMVNRCGWIGHHWNVWRSAIVDAESHVDYHAKLANRNA